MRLIDAETFDVISYKETESYADCFDGGVLYMLDRIDATPTIDAEPVRHGHWIDGHEMMTCTNCCEQFDLYFKNDFNYCPNCGAKMDEVSE